jgi:hypothetical protein
MKVEFQKLFWRNLQSRLKRRCRGDGRHSTPLWTTVNEISDYKTNLVCANPIRDRPTLMSDVLCRCIHLLVLSEQLECFHPCSSVKC